MKLRQKLFSSNSFNWKDRMLQEIFGTLNYDEYITLKVGEIADLMDSVWRAKEKRIYATKIRINVVHTKFTRKKLTELKSAIYFN